MIAAVAAAITSTLQPMFAHAPLWTVLQLEYQC